MSVLEKSLLHDLVNKAGTAMMEKMENDCFTPPQKKKPKPPLNRRKAIAAEKKWLKIKKARCAECGHKIVFHAFDSEYGFYCIVENEDLRDCDCERPGEI